MSSLPPVIQVGRDKSGHKVAEHTRLLCAQQAQCFLTSSTFLSQLTQHYVFMDKFFPQSRFNPWENHLAKQQNKVSKSGPDIP